MTRDRRVWITGLAAITMLLLAAPWNLVVADDDDDDDRRCRLGRHGRHAQQVAGTYLVDIHLDIPGAAPLRLLGTLGAGGSYLATDESDLGAGDPAVRGLDGVAHGTWRKTGPCEVTVVSLAFSYDDVGNLTTIAKATVVLDYGNDEAGPSGAFTVDVYLPTQDPLDPDEVPVAVVTGTSTSRRVTVE